MADRKVFEFLQQAERDPELRAQVKAVRLDEKGAAFDELASIAQRAGYTVTSEALEAGLRECVPSELPDAALEAVTGGSSLSFQDNTVSFQDNTVQPYTYPNLQNSTFSGFFTQLRLGGTF